jgi:hypothetical protein
MLQLSDDEMQLLRDLSLPLEQSKRGPFLQAVAVALEASRQRGTLGNGEIHRVARLAQRDFFDPPALPNASPRARA